ncbi:TSUP family transporter [Rothia halotolerans]|uniref:TSUP family transporter n=1 Tax=Rothia halotolerans TaxID=405770 RepID=UPI00101BE684|nr:TSUP family transporter [Rothia halotolerans]
MLWAVLPAVMVGAVLQRICGTGVGLIVAPTFAVLLGGGHGVFVTNMTTFVSGLILTLSLWREVNWRQWLALCAAGILGTVPGALVVRHTPGPVLQVVVGGVVLVAMAAILSGAAGRRRSGRGVTALAGGAGGLLNVTAGVAAPAMVVYSRVTRWDQREYAATMQPVFMTLAALSLGAKLVIGGADPEPAPGPSLFLGVAAAVVVGILVGAPLARRVSAERARTLALLLAGAGAVVAVVRGVVGLVAG